MLKSFVRLLKVLSSSSAIHKGALIIGGPGSGKTAIIEQLVEWSIFSRNGLVKESLTGNNRLANIDR